MKKLWMGLMMAMMVASSSLYAKYNFEETVYVPLPTDMVEKWTLGYQNADEKGTAVTRYVLESESVGSWSQLLNIQFKDKELVKATSAADSMKQEAARSTLATYKIYSENPHDILYERDFPSGEHEIVRMIMTKKGLHRVAFIKKGAITEAERTLWIDRLSRGMIGGKDQ